MRAGEDGTIEFVVDTEPGKHLLTVDLRDEANNTLVKAVSITVKRSDDEGGLGTTEMVAIAAVLVVVALLAALLLLRSRQQGKDPIGPNESEDR
jgi:hypothetical protein